MKKIVFLFVFAALCCINANAQLFLSGGLSATHNGGSATVDGKSNDMDPSNTLRFDVQGGYYISDNFAVGLDFSMQSQKNKTSNTSAFDHVGMTYIQPFARFDLVSSEKIAFGVCGTFVLGFGKANGQDDQGKTYDEYKRSDIGFKLSPVIDYKFNDNWSIFTSFGDLHFLSQKYKGVNGEGVSIEVYDEDGDLDRVSADEIKQTELKFDVSMLSLVFGVRYTF